MEFDQPMPATICAESGDFLFELFSRAKRRAEGGRIKNNGFIDAMFCPPVIGNTFLKQGVDFRPARFRHMKIAVFLCLGLKGFGGQWAVRAVEVKETANAKMTFFIDTKAVKDLYFNTGKKSGTQLPHTKTASGW